MSEPDWKPPWRLMYAGLAGAIAVQVLVVVMAATGELGTFFPVGNVVAGIFAAFAIWLIRQRQKGRL